MDNNIPKRPGFDQYFIEIAKVVASRSTCLRKKSGAVVVKDKIIIGTGYLGSSRGSENCIDKGVCRMKEAKAAGVQQACAAVCAESNALLNSDPSRMKGATIYIAGIEADGSVADSKPCPMCVRMIQNAMVEEVAYVLKSDNSLIKVNVEDLKVLDFLSTRVA